MLIQNITYCRQIATKNNYKKLLIELIRRYSKKIDHCRESRHLMTNLPVFQSIRRYSKKINRGQDPEQIRNLPVFQFAPDTIGGRKRRNLVYVWGSTMTGALGMVKLIKRQTYDVKTGQVKRPIEQVRVPQKLDFVNLHTHVKDIACGYGFTVIAAECRDTNFKLFGCGYNMDSQIGHHTYPRKDSQPLIALLQPVPIQLPIKDDEKVIKVACGRAHTICLTSDNQIFSLGNNSFGQCGRQIVENEVYLGSRIIHQIKEINDKVENIVCGQDHTMFLTDKGEVYSCGWGADGQLGLGHYRDEYVPTKVGGDIQGERIVDISSAGDCVMAVNDKGDVFGWGNSEYSQFESITNAKQLFVPRKLDLGHVGRIIKTAAGGTICAVLNDKGQVYVWGYGILGKGPKVEHLRKPSLLPMPLFGLSQLNPNIKVIDIKAGLNHFAAITNKGDLFMWGKNRGACLGLGHENDMYFPFKVVLPILVKKISLGIDHTGVIGTMTI